MRNKLFQIQNISTKMQNYNIQMLSLRKGFKIKTALKIIKIKNISIHIIVSILTCKTSKNWLWVCFTSNQQQYIFHIFIITFHIAKNLMQNNINICNLYSGLSYIVISLEDYCKSILGVSAQMKSDCNLYSNQSYIKDSSDKHILSNAQKNISKLCQKCYMNLQNLLNTRKTSSEISKISKYSKIIV